MVKKIGKKVFAWMMVFTMALTLAGCGGAENTGEDNNRASVTEQNEENRQQDNDSESHTSPRSAGNGSGKILVAYFSHSGNTKRIAEDIKEKTGADIFEIKTVHPYSDDYNTVLDEAKKEQKDNARPELSETVENMEQYETVILGYPIWWSDMPMAVYSFLDTYDLSGKHILTFCTHGGSGLCGTDSNVQKEEKDAKVADGLAISDSSWDEAGKDIDNWLGDNNVGK